MYHLTVGTASGISEGDAALGQVRRLRDILGGAFLDAEVKNSMRAYLRTRCE